MKGVTDFYLNNQIEDLCVSLRYIIDHPNELSTKIDGKPALVIWSDFPGLRGPGVGFKSLIKQVQENRAKDYFTSDREIYKFMLSKDLEENERIHRTNAFISALKLAPKVRPGVMIWGDVLFTDNEKTIKGDKCYFTPNTITYEVDTHVFPEVKSGNFGIVFHTVIDSKFNQEKILDVSKYMDESDEFVICPEDIQISLKKLSNISYELGKAYEKAEELSIHFTADLLKKLRKLYKKLNISKSDLISNFDESDRDFISEIYDNISNFNKIKEDIINSVHINGFNSYINGKKTNGEGFVINVPNHEPLKLVSDTDFTSHNIEHMKSLKERIVNNGQTVLAWSSSKDTQLFNYYLTKNLRYGDNGGSNYGFASYCVTEPPFTEGAQVGYSDEYRRKLYGDNVFEFKIPTDKIIFFDYQDYLKSKQGQEQQASFDNFVKVQLQALGVRMTEEEYQSLQPVDEKKATASVAVKFYQVMSRYFYQGHRGNLRTPVDGFQYRGRNDGNTLVIWNSNRLIPVKYSNDLGQTWKDCDKNSEVYKEYLRAAESANYTVNEPKYKDAIFDGNKTTEKKEIYRLLMAFNSNDGVNEKGKSLGLSDGIFFNIKIKDNKKIDASFKFNLPYIDYGEHFFRLRKNQFLDQIFNKGYRFGTLDCGLKIGSEHNPNETWESVEDRWWPEEVTGGFKLVCLPINKRQFKYQTKFGQKKLYLTKCHIEEDVFDGWEVLLDPEKPNFCKKEIKNQLIKKYDWANNLTEEEPLMESAIKKYRFEERKADITPELKDVVNKVLSDNNLVLMTKTSPVQETDDLNKALLSPRLESNNPIIYVAGNDYTKRSRSNTTAKFIKYCKENNYNPFAYGEERYVRFTIDGRTLTFRFRKEYDAEHKVANSLSMTKVTELYESAICDAINNYQNYNFMKVNNNDMNDVRDELCSKFYDKNIENLDYSYIRTICYVSKFLLNYFSSKNRSIIAEKSESKTDISNKLVEAAKACKWESYKAWCVADIWIYSPGDKDSILSELNEIIKDKSPNHLYDTIYKFREKEILLGVSLKKLKNLFSENDIIMDKSMTVKDWSGITSNDDFDTIVGSEKASSLSIYSQWSAWRHGYDFRSPNLGEQGGAKFNYTNEASQNTWVPFSWYCKWPEIVKVFGGEQEAINLFNRTLTPEEVRKYAQTILDWNHDGATQVVSNELETYVKSLVNNPDKITANSNSTKQERNIARTKGNNLLLMYAFVCLTDDERDTLCTRIMYYTRSLVGKGAYVYLHTVSRNQNEKSN